MKVLGTTWNMNSDTIFIYVSHSLFFEATTKRDTSKSISRIYDLLGFFSPATLKAKHFIQELWKQRKTGMRSSVSHNSKNGAKYMRASPHCPLTHYPDTLEEKNANCSTLQIPEPRHIQLRYT